MFFEVLVVAVYGCFSLVVVCSSAESWGSPNAGREEQRVQPFSHTWSCTSWYTRVIRVHCYPPLRQLLSDFGDFSNWVIVMPRRLLKLTWNSWHHKHFALAPALWLWRKQDSNNGDVDILFEHLDLGICAWGFGHGDVGTLTRGLRERAS